MSTPSAARRFLASACALALGAPLLAQTTLYTVQATKSNDRMGTSFAGAGDVNQDGRPDFVVGAPEDGNILVLGEGMARVHNGQTGGVMYTFHGAAPADAFGWDVDGAGDVNADGYADVVVGAPRSGTGGNQAGRVYIYSGQTGSSTPLWIFTGSASNDQLGSSVAGCGDVNADGYADVIAGAPLTSGGIGRARVFSGKLGTVLWTIDGVNANDRLGHSVDGCGDVNADGYADFIVGSLLAGAKIYSGQTGAVLRTFTAPVDDRLGTSVAGCGDVNGNGVPDVIVGAPQDGNVFSPGAGYARVYEGSTGALIWTLVGDAVGDRFGICVSGGRDLNGDLRAELLVGADQNSVGLPGYAKVFNGVNGSLYHLVVGTSSIDRLGTCVDMLGDLNGDANGDFGVGLPGYNGMFVQGGQARIFSTAPPQAPTFEPFCAGDGADPDVVTACPCGNVGGAGRGCANSANAAGALLGGAGQANPDSVVLLGSGMPATVACIYLQGDALTDEVFGDGVRCTGGNLIRLRTETNAGGASQFPDGSDTVSVSQRGQVTPGSGVLRYYQTYYRNAAAAFCPPATFNVTNGWIVTW